MRPRWNQDATRILPSRFHLGAKASWPSWGHPEVLGSSYGPRTSVWPQDGHGPKTDLKSGWLQTQDSEDLGPSWLGPLNPLNLIGLGLVLVISLVWSCVVLVCGLGVWSWHVVLVGVGDPEALGQSQGPFGFINIISEFH